MAAPVVSVVGMNALRGDLNRMATETSGPLYQAIKAAGKAAAEPVAGRARSSVPYQSGRLGGSVRTSGTRTGAAVRMGSASVPYAGWIDFGGTRPDGSDREWHANGRYLFPAAQSLGPAAAASYTAALTKILQSPVVWTNTSDSPGSVHD
jgi:hypothetical protein